MGAFWGGFSSLGPYFGALEGSWGRFGTIFCDLEAKEASRGRLGTTLGGLWTPFETILGRGLETRGSVGAMGDGHLGLRPTPPEGMGGAV